MGKLRNRRRGGGPAKTLTGLNRTGAANKILGNKGGIHNPTVGDIAAGKEVELTVDTAPVTERVGRHLGAFLIECDGTAGGEISETDPPERTVNWTSRGNNLVAWANGVATVRFWVF
jgi:hypothetical protein